MVERIVREIRLLQEWLRQSAQDQTEKPEKLVGKTRRGAVGPISMKDGITY